MSDDPDVVRRQICANVGSVIVAGNALSHLILNAVHDFGGLVPFHDYISSAFGNDFAC